VQPRSWLAIAMLISIPAGNEYRAYGLVYGLIAEGAQVEVPVAGLPLGKQLAFYGQRAQESRR
jgi:hypothetical protein